MTLSRKITLVGSLLAIFGFLLTTFWGKSHACPDSSSRVQVAFATLTLSIPKDMIIGLDVDGSKHHLVPISLAVPTDCMNLKLLAPYNSTKLQELMSVSLVINDNTQSGRLSATRARFGKEKSKQSGYLIYAGTQGFDLYVAENSAHRPLFMFCENDPSDASLDSPHICNVEQDLQTSTTITGKVAVINVHYGMLTKYLPQVENISTNVAAFVQSLVADKQGK